MTAAPSPSTLRRAVLAVSVLRDVDVALDPADRGVVLPGEPAVRVSWSECRQAVAGHPPESAAAQERLARWLRARRWAADLDGPELARRLRPVGLPVDHLLHPGLDWVRTRVLGDALDLGLGALGLDPAAPDEVVLLPTAALQAAGLDGRAAWAEARARLEELGRVAAQLLAGDPRGLLRPVGDADAVTLLGARSLRQALVAGEGGMTAAVVPMRRRGWTRLGLLDPAFGPAAAAATDPVERGFPRPVLLTVDEVQTVREGGRPAQVVLGRPAAAVPPGGRGSSPR